ncbi:MAG TPA: C39 family peptidase [Candidatus Eisenbacteria bacterium]|nr:C39 family peptidase [Candidatus Eisenbacteria bacterium]
MSPRARVAVIVGMAVTAFCWAPVGARAAAGTSPDPVRLLDVPYVPQTEALCGGAAIAMVLRYWGEPAVLAEDFAGLVAPGDAGIRTDSLVAAVRARGFGAEPWFATASDVKRELAQGRPVVALVRASSRAFHYVVIVAWANGGVIAHDPAVAPDRTSDERAFDRAWAGSGRWALLILPPPRATEAEVRDVPLAGDSTVVPLTGCDALVDDALRRARGGDTANAERRLISTAAICPDSPAPRRALAGLRFKAEDWNGAARLAEEALALDPDDAGTWRLLAGCRFLMGDEAGALLAWNRISEPRADLARVDGLSRTRYRAVAGQLDLTPGRLLTSGAFVRARRRLAEIPAQSEARLSLRPLPKGIAQVNVALVERPLFIDSPIAAGGVGLQALVEREVSLRVSSPTGNGELWSVGFGWGRERPRVSLGLAVPAPGGRQGIWRVEGFWERQTYAVGALSGAGPAAGSMVIREERRRNALSFSDWIAPNLRLEIGAASDEWSDRGAHVSLDGEIKAMLAGDRIALLARAGQWTSLDGGSPFEAGDLLARVSTRHLDRGGWLALAGLSFATAEAPLALWPGAGTGLGREPLLRAHPLLIEGIVAGKAFGRTLAYAGLERRAWLMTVKPVRIGWSLFLDGARPSNTLRSATVPWLLDAGAALRLTVLGSRSEIRIAAARGLEDRVSAVSIGWEVR